MRIVVGRTYLHKRELKVSQVISITESRSMGYIVEFENGRDVITENSVWFVMEWEPLFRNYHKYLFRRLMKRMSECFKK